MNLENLTKDKKAELRRQLEEEEKAEKHVYNRKERSIRPS